MDIFIALKDVQQIKKNLAHILPEVKSSHRVEAMARGLGWKSNAALRACLMCAPTRCRVDDAAFEAYLNERGFDTVKVGTLSDVVTKSVGGKAKSRPTLSIGTKASKPAGSGLMALFAGKAALIAAFMGVLMAVSYLYVNARGATERLDQNVEQILTAAEGPATRSVLIMDSDLAREVVKSFTALSHIKSATVFDDQGSVLAENIREQSHGSNTAENSIAGLFPSAEKKAYTRVLKMPPGFASDYAKLRITVDLQQGLSIVAGPTLSGLILFFLLGAFATFAFVAGMAASRRKLHDYLVAQYQLQGV